MGDSLKEYAARQNFGVEGLRDHGILWAVNTAVFHPRGFALSMGYDENGVFEGFCLLGDGTEPWMYGDSVDDVFHAFNAFLDDHRLGAAEAAKVAEFNKEFNQTDLPTDIMGDE